MRRTLAANVAAYLANGLALVLTARGLEAGGRGQYAALLAWAGFVGSTVNLSLGPALAHSAATGADRRWLLRRFVVDLLVLSAVGCLGMAVLLLGPLERLGAGGPAFWLVVSLIPSGIVCDWATYLLQGMGETSAYGFTRLGPSSVNLVLLGAVAAAGRVTLSSAVACYWLANVLTAAAVMAWLFRRRSSGGGGRPTRAELWRFGAKAHLGTLASLLNGRLDLLVVSLALPVAATGRYSVAVSLTIPVAVVGTSIGAARFAELAKAAPADLHILLPRLWRQMASLTLVAAAGAAAAGALLVVPVFGPGYAGARGPAAILALGTGGLGATYLATAILQARGRPAVASRWYVVAAALSGVTLLVLVPPLGITGAALSSLLTYLVVGTAMARASITARGAGDPTAAGGSVAAPALLPEG